MFPGSEKLQTEKCRDQNPTWNEFFAFEGAKGAGGSGLEARQKAIAEALDRGKFIVLTIVAYDNLEKQTTIGKQPKFSIFQKRVVFFEKIHIIKIIWSLI